MSKESEEIRKLAVNSNDSIAKITAIIRSIQEDSSSTCTQVIQVEEGINQVSEAMSSIADATEHLRDLANKLDEKANLF